jgi:pSer/pThr/pTyr-binding forkhead associated (FHA) protein
MIFCANCQRYNFQRSSVCQHCKHPLPVHQTENFQDFDPTRLQLIRGRAEAATEPLTSGLLVVRIGGMDVLTRRVSSFMLIGREDDQNPKRPEIDLTPFGAHEKGVSRYHATLKRSAQGLTLADLASANGTRLNGRRLRPLTEYPVNDGDEILFGTLGVQFCFRRQDSVPIREAARQGL